MKFRKSGVLASSILAMAVLSIPVSSIHAEGIDELNLRMASFLPEGMTQTRTDLWFAEEIERRSDGSIQISVHTGGAMGQPEELLQLVSAGGVDIATTSPGYFPAEMPFLSPTNSLPLVFESPEHAQGSLRALYEEVEAIREELRDTHNVHPVFWHVVDTYYLICRTPVRTLEDLEGKRIRSWGEHVPRLFEAAGAVPVTLMPAELYESLQRGSIDCTPYSLDTAVALDLHEVAKYVTLLSIGSPGGWPQMYNLDTWESFSPETQALFEAVGRDAMEWQLDQMNAARAEAKEIMEDAGVEFIDFPDQEALEAAAPDFLNAWIDSMADRGEGERAAKMAEFWRGL